MDPVALADLLSQPVVAKLATLTADGGIRMTPIWFEAEADGTFLMATWESTAAVRNIRARPRCSLLIDLEVAEPYYGVHFDGTATVEGPENDEGGIAELYAPYKGSIDQAMSDVRALIEEGKMVYIRFRPAKAISWDFR
jgi:PPOX class probable F420-dependent enzyme